MEFILTHAAKYFITGILTRFLWYTTCNRHQILCVLLVDDGVGLHGHLHHLHHRWAADERDGRGGLLVRWNASFNYERPLFILNKSFKSFPVILKLGSFSLKCQFQLWKTNKTCWKVLLLFWNWTMHGGAFSPHNASFEGNLQQIPLGSKSLKNTESFSRWNIRCCSTSSRSLTSSQSATSPYVECLNVFIKMTNS